MKAITKVKTKREHSCIFKVNDAVPAQSPLVAGSAYLGLAWWLISA
jgi:hypothetical protein